ncbi:hypothetical protein GF325_03245 [Candidatus Bathyarchaeota archaeon]|nr:hypothetical protein [Candidatus Bathyarchaeota archaeon]
MNIDDVLSRWQLTFKCTEMVITSIPCILIQNDASLKDEPARGACIILKRCDDCSPWSVAGSIKTKALITDLYIIVGKGAVTLVDGCTLARRKIPRDKVDGDITHLMERYLKEGDRLYLSLLFDPRDQIMAHGTYLDELVSYLMSCTDLPRQAAVKHAVQLLFLASFQDLGLFGRDRKYLSRMVERGESKSNNDSGFRVASDLACVLLRMVESKHLWIEDELGNLLLNVKDSLFLEPSSFRDACIPDEFFISSQVFSLEGIAPGLQECLTSEGLGIIMERYLHPSKKRKTGTYFTPSTWATFTSRKGLKALLHDLPGKPLQSISIIDPAGGAGQFIDSIISEMVERTLDGDIDIPHMSPSDGNEARFMIKKLILSRNKIYCVDTNKLCLNVAKARIVHSILKHLTLMEREGMNMVQVNIDFIHGDFLTEDFGGTCFSLVVGNPPYLMEVRKNQEIFRMYKQHPQTRQIYGPKMDIFYFFMIKGLHLLEEGGILAFIVQEYWLDRYHAKRLRIEMLMKAKPIMFLLFKSYKVFPGAPGHHSMISLFQRGSPSPDHQVMLSMVSTRHPDTLAVLGGLLNDRERGTVDSQPIPLESLYDPDRDIVFLKGSTGREAFRDVRNAGGVFLDASEIQIGMNLPQPFSKKGEEKRGIFVLTREEIQSLNFNDKERALLEPFHPASDIHPYHFTPRVPYHVIYTTNSAKKRVETGLDSYKRLRAHLDAFQEEITSDHKPYGLHRSRQREWFVSTEKIMGVRKTGKPRFSVIPVPFFVDQGAIIIKLNGKRAFSHYFLCAYLNSSFASALLRSIKTQGNQLQIDKSVLLKMPIPRFKKGFHDAIDELSRWAHVLSLLASKINPWRLAVELTPVLVKDLDHAFSWKISGKTTGKRADILLASNPKIKPAPRIEQFTAKHDGLLDLSRLEKEARKHLNSGMIEELFF